MSRPSAVVISPEAPYPMHGGGAIRTASLLHYLSPRYDVDLILFRQAGDSDPALSLPPGLVRHVQTVTLPFHSRQPLAWLLRNGRRWVLGAPPLLDRFSGQSGEIASALAGRQLRRWSDRALLVRSLRRAACARMRPHYSRFTQHRVCVACILRAIDSWPLSVAHTRFERAYIREERRWLPRFSHLLATSEDDASRLMYLAPDTPVTVYPNALPLVPVPERPEEEMVIAFLGQLRISPQHRGRAISGEGHLASACRAVSGSQAPADRQEPGSAIAQYLNGSTRIETTGPVEDAVAELAKVQVAIVPLLSGSGTRLKILEAWAAARPVVATSIGAEGLGRAPWKSTFCWPTRRLRSSRLFHNCWVQKKEDAKSGVQGVIPTRRVLRGKRRGRVCPCSLI